MRKDKTEEIIQCVVYFCDFLHGLYNREVVWEEAVLNAWTACRWPGADRLGRGADAGRLTCALLDMDVQWDRFRKEDGSEVVSLPNQEFTYRTAGSPGMPVIEVGPLIHQFTPSGDCKLRWEGSAVDLAESMLTFDAALPEARRRAEEIWNREDREEKAREVEARTAEALIGSLVPGGMPAEVLSVEVEPSHDDTQDGEIVVVSASGGDPDIGTCTFEIPYVLMDRFPVEEFLRFLSDTGCLRAQVGVEMNPDTGEERMTVRRTYSDSLF